MAGAISFKLSSSVLRWARLSMGYSIEQAAEKAGVENKRYEAWENGSKLPTYKQLEKLAEQVYRRPIAVLMLKEPPKETPIEKDFRSVSNIELTNLSPELRLAIRKAKRYQSILKEVDVSRGVAKITLFDLSKKDGAATAAARFRKFIDLTILEQKSWKPETGFTRFREILEKLGISIFLLKFSMQEARAFCLSGHEPVIVLNSSDSKNGMVFSLFHETCHLLFNESDIFKDSPKTEQRDHNTTEAFCNSFAAAFLVPDDIFDKDIFEITSSNFTDNIIQKFSRLYNVSNEVIARKLLIRGKISEDFFWQKKSFWDKQAQAAKEAKKEDRKGEETTGINQGIKILYEKGRSYVSKVIDAYNRGDLSSSDLSNYLEIKLDHLPKIVERL